MAVRTETADLDCMGPWDGSAVETRFQLSVHSSRQVLHVAAFPSLELLSGILDS